MQGLLELAKKEPKRIQAMNRSFIDKIGATVILALALGLAGDWLGLWTLPQMKGWWLVFLYVPAISSFLKGRFSTASITLFAVAVILTITNFTSIETKDIWKYCVIIFLGVNGIKMIYRKNDD